MSEIEARKQLRAMLRSFTGGSILHMLGEEFGGMAEKAQGKNNMQTAEQLRHVAITLFVVGLGVDAASPGAV